MNDLKAFISGLVVPSVILPIIVIVAWETGREQVLTIPFLHFIPLIWGGWNVLYFKYFKEILPENLDLSLLITGAVLGLLVALYGVFQLHLPELLGLPVSMHLLPLIVAPVLYAVLWRYLVHPLNNLLKI